MLVSGHSSLALVVYKLVPWSRAHRSHFDKDRMHQATPMHTTTSVLFLFAVDRHSRASNEARQNMTDDMLIAFAGAILGWW
jgi:hypothetical protein